MKEATLRGHGAKFDLVPDRKPDFGLAKSPAVSIPPPQPDLGLLKSTARSEHTKAEKRTERLQ